MAFDYHDSHLCCDEVRLADIAAAVGTPAYVYSASSILTAYRRFDDAFAGYPHAIHYALKANSTMAIVRLLARMECGGDANSGGEIEVALRAGMKPEHVVFTGVGKTPEELEQAIAVGVKAINAESPGELDRIAAIARVRGTRARVALRINPDIDVHTHPYISTALRTSKFGIPLERAAEVYRSIARRPGLEVVGIHVHLGSQIVDLAPVRNAARALVDLARGLREEGIPLEHVDLGGGLGISYDGSATPEVPDYARALLPIVRESGLSLLLEPGRAIVGPAGVLVARVVDIKECPGGEAFAVLDAGMTELLRPALYGAYHAISPVTMRGGAGQPYQVVGPLCESSDTFGTRTLPALSPGDHLAIRDAGAYGFSMASNYNRRRMPVEVLVENGAWRVIRRRQTIDDLLACEQC